MIIDSFTSLEPSRTIPSAEIAGAGADQHDVPLPEIGDGDGLDPIANDSHGAVREQLRELPQRALGLGDRPHLDPVTEHHDGDERRQLPPEIRAGEADRDGEAEYESDADRQRDERHHSRQSSADLADGALDEHPATVGEHQCAEDRRNPPCRRSSSGSLVPEPVLDHWRPDDRGDRQKQRAPELLAEHLDRMTGVLVVTRGSIVDVVRSVHTGRRRRRTAQGLRVALMFPMGILRMGRMPV